MTRLEEIRMTAEDYIYMNIINPILDGDEWISREWVAENRDQILEDCYQYCLTHRSVQRGAFRCTGAVDNRHAKLATKQAILDIADELLKEEGL